MKNVGDERIYEIQKYMSDNDLLQEAMAAKLKISRQYLNLIMNKNTGISKKVAIELEKLTGINYDFWMSDNKEKDKNYGCATKPSQKYNLVEEWIAIGYRMLVDYEILQAVEDNYIGIENFNPKNVEPTSYVFTMGDTLLISGEKDPVSFEEHKSLTINPGQNAILKTKEVISLPPNIAGAISPTSTFAGCEKQIHNGVKVHPGYHGIIFFSVCNNTAKNIVIEKSLKLLRIEFTFLPRRPKTLYSGELQDMVDFPKNIFASTEKNEADSA